MDDLLSLCKALRELGVGSYRGPMPGGPHDGQEVEIKLYPATPDMPRAEPVSSDPPKNQVERFDRDFPGMVGKRR